MPTNKPFTPWSQRQLLPSEEALRKAATIPLAEQWLIFAIPIPNTARVQWFGHDIWEELINITPTIHALLYGQQLKSAPLHPGRTDTWHRGIALASQIDFRDPATASWWGQELAACAGTVDVELQIRVQVVRLDQGGE